MAKISCAVCGKELGIFAGKVKISDGVVCSNCLHSAGISTLKNPFTYNQDSVKHLIVSRQSIVNDFQSSNAIGTYLQVDETNKAFKVGEDVFTYDNLLSFELMEDGESVTKGGLGRAVAGGLLFGGVGAVVGGITGGKKSKGICKSLKLRISVKNAHTDIVYINFITTETKTSSFIYKNSMDLAQKCIAALETINDINQSCNTSVMNSDQQNISAADEIMKFKNLLDQGIITPEEFTAKKKELMGL